MATRIRAAVEREFGVAPPLRDLLLAGTVQAAADAITKQADSRPPLRALRPGGSRPPLFLAHAAGGTPDVYRPLTELLDPQQPVYGLDRIESADSVSAKARQYAAAIREVCPDGPYHVGGWSFGGFLAQETARLLTAEGGRVDTVVLIDSVRPLPRPGQTEWGTVRAYFEGFAEHVARAYGARLDLPYDELATLDDPARVDLVLQALREVADIPAAALEHQRASYLDLRIGESHTPGRYEGRVILYRAAESAPHTVRDRAYEREDDALGWDEVCPDLEIVHVPGHHLSLLDPPHAEVIATHLTRALAP
jgi:thioesterase domain-containing protein